MSQGSLFDEQDAAARHKVAPLAVRMRPVTLEEFVGQVHIVGPDSYLRRMIAADTLTSILLFGPAGTGKTTLARIIAHSTKAAFVEVSAITGKVGDLRDAISAASTRLGLSGQRTILFIDEIHRFSKSQQDALLHAVEDRILILVGATTENPYFEVNSALVSRSRVLELKSLADADVEVLLRRALSDARGLAGGYDIDDDALKAIALTAGGDARVGLTSLELAAQLAAAEQLQPSDAEQPQPQPQPDSSALPRITLELVRDVVPNRILPYDKGGDVHYDVISAFIKSMRGSDPDAALYWLARMLHGGEDPKFIARRIFIFASEDVSNADPQALLIADACFRACEVIGLPECQINLAQAAAYMALAPKSNRSYEALLTAQSDIEHGPARAVPNHLRDRHRPGSEEYGTYVYPHGHPDDWVMQQYLPDDLAPGAFFTASERGWEARAAARLRDIIDRWNKEGR
ncbi:MAG: replication-associated recombination protein A [Coriobacteriia bacterium]|nr:replication-associated recombination protein A [Coriobacteriia bacterium]